MRVGVVILTKGKVPYLTQCLKSIIQQTKKTEYTVYIGDTGSTSEELQEIVQFLTNSFPNKNGKLIQLERYNFARNNNTIINQYVTEPLVLLCNNDIKLIDNCIDKVVEIHKKEKNVGTIGCRLIFENGTVQHAGQIMWTNNRDMLEITHRGLGTTEKFKDIEKVVGNTGGFMLISKKLFKELGEFNTNYSECFEDVELNMKCILNGYTNYYTDSVSAYHYESTTRTKEPDAIDRLKLDYTMNLYPFFRQLTHEQQQLLLEI